MAKDSVFDGADSGIMVVQARLEVCASDFRDDGAQGSYLVRHGYRLGRRCSLFAINQHKSIRIIQIE
jgi:hypothetical protein